MQPTLKKIEDVVPGDWYDEEEIVAVKHWGFENVNFAIDLHFRYGGKKMLESGMLVSVVSAANAVDVIK